MKIFGIGLNKTGTTSLAVCLQHFGYRHASSNLELTRCVERGDLAEVFAFADTHDSFEDWPWPLIYRQLNARYPGSKFILTTRRDPDVWIKSLKKHADRSGPTEFRRIAYGHSMPHGLEREHMAIYERHNEEVRQYFAVRPAVFLEVCWENGDGCAELCRFLGRDVPRLPFPHANRSAGRGSAHHLERRHAPRPADRHGAADRRLNLNIPRRDNRTDTPCEYSFTACSPAAPR